MLHNQPHIVNVSNWQIAMPSVHAVIHQEKSKFHTGNGSWKMHFLVATSRSTFLCAISWHCLSVWPVFPKMFHFFSCSSKCSISAELHFNAALFLKGVGIAFVLQIPSGSFSFLLFSCFALRDQLQYQPSAERIQH